MISAEAQWHGIWEELKYKAVVFKTKGSKVPGVYNIGKKPK
jgi:hypothetical protein